MAGSELLRSFPTGEQSGNDTSPDLPPPDHPSPDPSPDPSLGAEAADQEPDPSSPARARLVFAAVLVAIIGWSGLSFWARLASFPFSPMPSWWAAAMFEWLVPVLLLLLVGQLAFRSGRQEQARFADTAAMLARESAQLEARLGVINRELSLAREFLAAQGRDLEALGRVASERLGASAARLEELVAHNAERVETISEVSTRAVANMEQLRDQLPVLAHASRDMTNQIGNTGKIAHERAEQLRAALLELDEIGAAGARHAQAIDAQVAQTLDLFARQASEIGDGAMATFASLGHKAEDLRRDVLARNAEALGEIERRAAHLTGFIETRNDRLQDIEQQATSAMHERIAAFVEESNALLARMTHEREASCAALKGEIAALESRLIEAITRVSSIDEAALASARHRLAALRSEAERLDHQVAASQDAFDEQLRRRQDHARQQEAEALAALEDRLAELDRSIAARKEAHLAQMAGLAQRGDALAARLGEIDAAMATLAQRLSTSEGSISAAAEHLAQRLQASRNLLEESGAAITAMAQTSSQLIDLIEAGGAKARGTLGEAIGEAEGRLMRFRDTAGSIATLIDEAEKRGARLADHIETARQTGTGTLGTLTQMERQIDDIASRSSALAEEAKGQLQGAIDLLAMRSANVLQDLRSGQAAAVRDVAGQIAQQSNAAIAAALADQARDTIGSIEEAAGRAAAAGRETMIALRDQLARVNELTANLEQRVSAARERAEERTDHDFTRRLALITEALNSAAIDISRAFDNEVTDTQWAGYLRGDRGIFTRRAVTLLDKQDARAIHDLYQADSEFRETLNRYVHDFEAMLRSVLSTRDGSAIAVTLLSSDIGKLYVALAQAIERLRD